ncbi:single-stranded DNA-binding protein [Leptolyngbya sp. NIES-3755]|nr:single-stranded DNA-binding protein [Leptolyngbya sp. NIES-3755]
MNSIILLADIIQEPQLRFTSDNQTPIAEMRVEFAGLRPEDPATQLKAVGWGNLAQEIQANYHEGDRVILEGRLTMNTVDRPEGFKEKQAELTIQKIHALNGTSISSSVTAPAAAAPTRAPSTSPPAASTPKRTTKAPAAPALESQSELDDIPF